VKPTTGAGGGSTKSIWLIYRCYVIFPHGVCILSIFLGRLTVAKQPSGGYTTYLPKYSFSLYLIKFSIDNFL